jgi:hypothetical protein
MLEVEFFTTAINADIRFGKDDQEGIVSLTGRR